MSNAGAAAAGQAMQRVLLRHHAQPYFASVPTPLSKFRGQFEAAAASLAQLDDAGTGRAAEPSLFNARLSAAVMRDDHLDTPSSLAPRVRHAIGSGSLSVADLSRLHAAIMEPAGSGVRRTMAWMGADHPRDAWYVAPPPSELPRLLRDLCHFCNDERLSISMRSAIALQQLVLIHPFGDGNGRTARALYCGLMFQSEAMTARGSALIESLFGFKAMTLQRLQ